MAGERVDYDADNLLSLTRGASVAYRFSEVSYDSSAAHAIDGEWPTRWLSPADSGEQQLVFSLAAPSRIRRVGVTPIAAPGRLRFEASMDGATWREVATMTAKNETVPQLVDVKPFDAHYLRVTAAPAEKRSVDIGSIHAIGEEIAPPARAPIEGCWTINTRPAKFVNDRGYVTGVIDDDTPLFFEGGTDGRVVRVHWRRGPQWGYALLAVTPDGKHLAGIRWHEEVGFEVAGAGFLGDRSERCATTAIDVDGIRARLLEKRNRWNLYAIESDAQLDRVAAFVAKNPTQRFRIVAREFLQESKEKNRARAAERLEAVRAALAKRGTDLARIEFVNAADAFDGRLTTTVTQKVMIGSVDLELGR